MVGTVVVNGVADTDAPATAKMSATNNVCAAAQSFNFVPHFVLELAYSIVGLVPFFLVEGSLRLKF